MRTGGLESTMATPETNGQTPVNADATKDIRFPLSQGMSLSHWLQTVRSNPLLDHRTTESIPTTADVVIIGSGISGALVALSLLESETPPKSMIMLEARELCSGATGRNAGHCKPDRWRGFSRYANRYGSQAALDILANEQKTWEALLEYVKKHDVQCDLWVGKTLDVMMDDQAAANAAANFAAFKSAGGDASVIDVFVNPKEAEKISRLKGAKAVYRWNASTLHPWKLVAHVIQRCLDLGLNLQTWTLATSITGSPDQWTVHTERGSISAPTIVHTTNAFAGALLAEVRPVITPTPHVCNRVVPPSTASGSKSLKNSYAVIYNDSMFSINPRSTTDGAVLFGGHPEGLNKLHEYVAENETRMTDDSLTDFEPVTESVRMLCRTGFVWPDSDPKAKGAHVRYDYSWSGIMGMSADDVPFVGAVPGRSGQWMSCGHNGHGMARIFTCSPGLAKLIQGATWEETGLPQCFQVTEKRLAMKKSRRE